MLRISAFLAAVMLLPGAWAWDDAAGDQRLGRPTHSQDGEPQYQWIEADGAEWYQNVDILSASIEETATDLVFTMRVMAADPGSPPPIPGAPDFPGFIHGFSFFVGEREHHVGFLEEHWSSDTPVLTHLHRWESFSGIRYFPGFPYAPATPLAEGAGWTGVLPKSSFRDEHLVPLREGHRLEQVRVFAKDHGFSFGGGPSSVCPDIASQPSLPGIMFCTWTVVDEATASDVPILLTPPGVGHLFLRMDEPYRMSNGLATTYLFEAQLQNLEDIEDQFLLQVTDVPSGWEVRLPSVMRFAGQGAQTVPIAVTVPFSHVHGASHYMTLAAVSQKDPKAAMEAGFGVIFADPPQPAGHHDTLYFHAERYCPNNFGGSCLFTYMNAEPDPGDPIISDGVFVDEDIAWREGYDWGDPDSIQLPAKRHWGYSLEPGLGIGLDFDVSEDGLFQPTFRFADAWTADIDATLLLEHYDGDDSTRTVLASGRATGVSFSAGQAVTIDIPLEPKPESDIIHFDDRQNLVLLVDATDTTGTPRHARTGDAWIVLDETLMRLPLLDYHLPVDVSGLKLSDLHITRLNSTYKPVNPGETVVFGFNVTNQGPKQVTIDWTLAGVDRFVAWTTVSPSTTHLAPRGNGTVVVRVAAPADAVEGDVAELLLIGTTRQEPVTQLFGRMIASVDEDKDHADEAPTASELEKEADRANRANRKDTPWATGIVLAALGAAFVLRRP